jgi:DNA topoisomerase III
MLQVMAFQLARSWSYRQFRSTGLTVRERNYLDVFPYDKWSDKELPNFEEGEEFMPSVCELKDGETTRPSLLTEADLVALMDKNGIGTSDEFSLLNPS